MDIFRSSTPSVDAGVALTRFLEKNKELPVLLLLSGGSAFEILPHVDMSVLSPRITLGLVDERCETNPLINNFIQLSETDFFKKAIELGVKVIDISIKEGESCSDVGNNFERKLCDWMNVNKKGKIIVTMGIGGDGHTAGIMPNIYEDFESTYVLSYEVPKDVNEYTKRITTTYKFLREKVDEAIVYATGEAKQSLIKSIEAKDKNIFEMPSQILNEMKSVTVFTDI